MFNWLCKTNPISKEISINMFILLQMEMYLQENRDSKELDSSTEVYAELYKNLTFLQSNSLGNTKNAKAISAKLVEIDSQIGAIRKAKELAQFVKDLRKKFGENTLLIGTEQFKTVCNKYNLVTDVLKNYTGTIPDSNIQDIARVRELLSLETYNTNKRMRVNTVINEAIGDDAKRVAKNLQQWIESNNSIVSIDYGTTLRDLLLCNDLPRDCEYAFPSLIRVSGTILERNTLFVACPKDQLQEQKIKFINKPIDPIVFQYSKFGTIIYTMWGEESEDVVFEEYKKINNLLGL